jgi:hypothetical protein
MSSESIDSLVSRPVIVQPTPVQLGQVPGEESPAPTDADIRAAAAIFAQEQAAQTPTSLIGFAPAGMLLHELMQDAFAKPEEEEDDMPKAEGEPKDDA